ncbi:methyltransferase family protein [Aeoliella sp. SH292]|uniref:methyltransferase family protein n=1 Tax=Aeoliella sp. SH292 TaxID=3454464 RepID=UPI003F9BCCF3
MFSAVYLPEDPSTLLTLAIPIVQGTAEGVAMYFTGTMGQRRRPEWTFFAVNVPYWLLIRGGLYSTRSTGLSTNWSLLLAGALLGILGIGLRTWCHFLLRGQFSPFVELRANHQLIDTGPYRWVRHPMYLGTLMILAGLSLVTPTWWSAAMTSLATLGIIARVRHEEQKLTAGVDGYRGYQQRTWGILPGVW